MEPKIEKGRALVLVGPQGCGKTVTARQLAHAEGPFAHIYAHELEHPHRPWMHKGLAAVIVEGRPESEGAVAALKTMLTSDAIAVDRKGRESEVVRPPNFIFCIDDAEPLGLFSDERRFKVFHMGRGAAA